MQHHPRRRSERTRGWVHCSMYAYRVAASRNEVRSTTSVPSSVEYELRVECNELRWDCGPVHGQRGPVSVPHIAFPFAHHCTAWMPCRQGHTSKHEFGS